ncbi:hypothetical protein O3G_MSEX001886 [Manduca sexta]|uniref:Cuticle protein n=3 Tax=Manduca sexta TaxID=7130 RepID=A0A921YLT7_MANSE|nr:hypothetical protein O3G_MSEX001886 [Manduca sexta]
MKLLCIFAAVLAIALAENDAEKKIYEDLEAAETMELMKEGVDLKPAASSYYIPPSQRPSQWNPPSNYNPQNTWYPEKPVSPPKPISPPQNDYPVTWWPTVVSPTPQPSVIKNDIWFGNDGSYNYEYQISDGTHVGEYGYYTDPRRTEESLVKKGWYSYRGADGKVYTVNYYADHTGYHAFGSHLPASPRQVESADGKSVSEHTVETKHSFSTPAPTIYSTAAPTYYPTQAPTFYSTQAPHYYSTQAPSFYSTQAPTYNYQQQTHYPHHDIKYQSHGKK